VLDSVYVKLNSGTGDTTLNNVGGVYFNGGENIELLTQPFPATLPPEIVAPF
jgi:hypothetical protein